MTAPTSTPAAKYDFSKAQLKHFRELQADVQRAQEALQAFGNYLTEEYELDTSKQWGIGPKGFELASEQPQIGGTDPNASDPNATAESQPAAA